MSSSVLLHFNFLDPKNLKTLEDVIGCEISGLASKYTSNTTISDWSEGGQLWAKKSAAFSKLKSRTNALKKNLGGGTGFLQ